MTRPRHKPPLQFGLASLMAVVAGVAAVAAKGDPQYLLMGASGILVGIAGFGLIMLALALPYVGWVGACRLIRRLKNQ